jgi:hypothetical protein
MRLVLHVLLVEKSKPMAGRFGELNGAEIQVLLENSV